MPNAHIRSVGIGSTNENTPELNDYLGWVKIGSTNENAPKLNDYLGWVRARPKSNTPLSLELNGGVI